MSTLLEQASLVMIPSGYKEDVVYSQIPTDGSGDLSFTRASNGTRVNSAGLVEVCPWNLMQDSELFNSGNWSKTGVTVTANSVTAPNGTTTADTLTFSANLDEIVQSVDNLIVGQTYTLTIYLRVASGTATMYWGNIDYTLPSITVTTEWQRFTVTQQAAATTRYPKLVSSSGVTVYAWGAQLNIGSTAKPYFPTTDRLNVPRLTYQNGGGGCPSLLLEKQSTNYCLWSNDLTQSSAWIDQTSNTTITQITSGGPDGGSFTRLVSTGSGSQGRIVQVGSITNPNGATMSVYLKGSGDTAFGLFIGNGISAYQNITLTNTWTRYVVTVSGVGGTYQDWQIGCVGGSTIDVSFVQVEQGVYATSPIPTTSSSATRVADLVPSKSTLLADKNSYSMFLDFYPRPTATFSYFFIQKNSSDTAEIIWGGTSGGTDFAIYDYTVSQSVWVGNINDGNRHKICLSVASGKIDLFVDGVQVITQKSTSQTGFYLVAIDGGPGVYKINEMVILSKITSAEAIALTTL